MLEHVALKSALLMHLPTGKMLYQKNIHAHFAPASKTKMMTLLLAFERLQAGKLKLTDYVTVSQNVSQVRGTVLNLLPGERITVEDLLKVISLPSCNDAAFTLAEHLGGGSERVFVRMMNAKAQELGMLNTRYINSHGVAGRSVQYSTASDYLLLAKALIKQQTVFQYCTLTKATITRGDGSREEIKNTNRLLSEYPGCDGLKTGRLGYGSNLTGTVKFGDHRFIAIVCETPRVEHVFFATVATLFDYAKSLINEAGEFVPPADAPKA